MTKNLSVYTDEEFSYIKKLEETNDRLDDFFKEKRKNWNNSIEPLFKILKNRFNIDNTQEVIETIAVALSFRQVLNDEISLFLNKRSKEEVKLKIAKREKFIYYSTGFGLKTSNKDQMSILIDGHISQLYRGIDIIDTHIDFLRNSFKNLDSLGYTIKNIIELMNYLK